MDSYITKRDWSTFTESLPPQDGRIWGRVTKFLCVCDTPPTTTTTTTTSTSTSTSTTSSTTSTTTTTPPPEPFDIDFVGHSPLGFQYDLTYGNTEIYLDSGKYLEETVNLNITYSQEEEKFQVFYTPASSLRIVSTITCSLPSSLMRTDLIWVVDGVEVVEDYFDWVSLYSLDMTLTVPPYSNSLVFKIETYV